VPRARRTEGEPTRAPASHDRLDRRQQQPKIQANEIDVRNREHDLTSENDALVQDVTENFSKLEPLVPKKFVKAHSVLLPTK
jgi:hypothetical protein